MTISDEQNKGISFGMCLGLSRYLVLRLQQVELEYVDMIYDVKDADLVERLCEEAYSNEPCRKGLERILDCIDRYREEQLKRQTTES